LDLKLKCLFEFTEAEQQRLSQLTPQNNESVSISRANNTTANNTTANTTANTLYSTASSQSVLETTASQQQQQPQTQAPKPNKSLSTTSSRTSDYQSAANDSAVSSPSSDFESSRNANKTVTSSSPAATAAAKLDKNDNLVNELKLAKQDNENLKSEVKRLKVRIISLFKQKASLSYKLFFSLITCFFFKGGGAEITQAGAYLVRESGESICGSCWRVRHTRRSTQQSFAYSRFCSYCNHFLPSHIQIKRSETQKKKTEVINNNNNKAHGNK
jgi:chemotaxis protein histidine kinase CheA